MDRLTVLRYLQETAARAAKIRREIARAVAAIAVCGVGVGVVVVAEADRRSFAMLIGGFFLFVGVFIWVRTGQLWRAQEDLRNGRR